MLAEMKKTQDEILRLVQDISSKVPSFTDADMSNLSSIAQNQSTQTDTLTSLNSNVHTLLVHALPVGNKEGEKFAQELADGLIGEAETLINRFQQRQPPQAQQPIPEEDNEEEEEDEDEEEEAEEI